MKIVSVDPQYPPQLYAAKIGGVVILNTVIDTTGSGGEVGILRSPNQELALAAVDAVRQWRYTVTTLNCVPSDVHITVVVSFSD